MRRRVRHRYDYLRTFWRRVRHHYDLPKSAYDYELQMCGRLALVLFAGVVVVVFVGGVILLVKFFATALVVVQP